MKKKEEKYSLKKKKSVKLQIWKRKIGFELYVNQLFLFSPLIRFQIGISFSKETLIFKVLRRCGQWGIRAKGFSSRLQKVIDGWIEKIE